MPFHRRLLLLPFLVLRGEERSRQFIVLKTLNIVANFGLNILFVLIYLTMVEGVRPDVNLILQGVGGADFGRGAGDGLGTPSPACSNLGCPRSRKRGT